MTTQANGQSPATAGRGCCDTALIAGGALLLYFVLRQHTLYSFDSQWMLLCVLEGQSLHPSHFAYLPLIALSRCVLGPLGASIHTAGLVVSMVGAAVGVALLHRACLRTCTRAGAALAALAAAVAPALVFYATVVEVHASHFGLCGATFVAAAAFAARPGIGRGVALGAAMGLGFAGHATGCLLPAMVVPVVFVLAHENGIHWRRTVPGLTLAIVLLGAVVVLLPRCLSLLGVPAALSTSAVLFEEYVGQFLQRPYALPRAALLEWLWPFLPLSATVLAAVFVRRTHLLAIAVLVASVPYVLIASILNWRADEGGAYLLPLLWPLVLVAVRLLPKRGMVALIAASCALAAARTIVHDTQPWHSFAAGYRAAIADRRAFVIVGETAELSAFLMELTDRLPQRDWFVPMMLKVSGAGEGDATVALQRLNAGIRILTQSGTEVWITKDGADALAGLRSNAGAAIGAQAIESLRGAFEWRPSDVPAFPAWRLLPRP